MSDLFELNRNNLLKIFESHQIRGLILFTDVLKICTALRIFPNLVSSKDLRKLLVQVCSVPTGEELGVKLSYKELEDFLRCVAEKAFPKRRGTKDQYKLLFVHIRNPCFLRYKLILAEENSPGIENREKTPEKGEIKSPATVFSQKLLNSNEKSLLSTSPYRKKLLQQKIFNLNEALGHKIPNLNISDFSLSISPVSRFRPVLSAKGSTNFFTSTNQSISLSDEALVGKLEQGLAGLCSKISGVFEPRPMMRNVKSFGRIRENYMSRYLKVRLAFGIWARSS